MYISLFFKLKQRLLKLLVICHVLLFCFAHFWIQFPFVTLFVMFLGLCNPFTQYASLNLRIPAL